jgi:TM2 domain-containing membrane protein YozV/ribosomal protein L40E
MYCRNCANEVAEQAVMCVKCGVPPLSGKNFCQNCAAQVHPAAEICRNCGVRLAGVAGEVAKSKLAAGLLGILLGALGIHRFYLGYTAIGVAQLILALLGFVTCGITSIVAWVWGLVEGILILTGQQITKDAQGNPLRD